MGSMPSGKLVGKILRPGIAHRRQQKREQQRGRYDEKASVGQKRKSTTFRLNQPSKGAVWPVGLHRRLVQMPILNDHRYLPFAALASFFFTWVPSARCWLVASMVGIGGIPKRHLVESCGGIGGKKRGGEGTRGVG